jgi:hypothetical protein
LYSFLTLGYPKNASVRFIIQFPCSETKVWKGQSCVIAALVGTTNESFEEIMQASGGKQPKGKGGANTGKSCLTRYFKELGIKAPPGTASRFVLPVERAGTTTIELDPNLPKLQTRQSCKANILLFARGTTEPGTVGMTVGPALSAQLSSKFSTVGVSYSADVEGINCIGLPGGVKCRDQLARLAGQCPTTNFVLGGYSQGAMVARICAAYSSDEIKKRIKVNNQVSLGNEGSSALTAHENRGS